MGITTIAECVETPQTLVILEEIGVDYAQGYAIARPHPYIAPKDLALDATIDDVGRKLDRPLGVFTGALSGAK
jgi:EAL domain-containing protein (putative c-di-GMP-specific phosphodiesterase class I)